MNVLIILIFSTLHGANIREISEIGKEIPDFNKSEDYRSPTDFTDEHRFLCGLCGRGYADLALLPAGQWVRRTNLPSAADFQFTDEHRFERPIRSDDADFSRNRVASV